MSIVRHVGAKWRYRAKHWLGRRPRLYHWVYRLRDGYADRLVTDDTDICIEGFPRSANSFAVGAFEYTQDEALSIAHHNHVPAPILNAVRRALPTIVLIRDPVEAVVSNRGLQLQIETVEKKQPQHVPYEMQLRAWMRFYERVLPVRDNFVVAPFEVVIDDFGQVIDAVNEWFGTAFRQFKHTAKAVGDIRELYGYHALPTAERNRLKKQARRTFESEVGTEARLVQVVRGLYRRYRAMGSY